MVALSKLPRSQFLMLSMMSYGTEYPFGQLGSAASAVSPPSLHTRTYLLMWQSDK